MTLVDDFYATQTNTFTFEIECKLSRFFLEPKRLKKPNHRDILYNLDVENIHCPYNPSDKVEENYDDMNNILK